MIGAGGGARAVVVSLAEAGAPEIRIVNRTPARAEALARDVGPVAKALAWSARHDALAGAALVVNTTNQGMHGNPPLDLDLSALPPDALVSDIVYIPLETPLLRAARERGNATVNGLGMLLNQARPAFQAWFGVLPEITADLRRSIEATI